MEFLITTSSHYLWKWVIPVTFLGIGAVILKRYTRGKIYMEQTTMHGKTIIITGASSGIGKATALELARRGGTIILACRDVGRAREAVYAIRNNTKEGVLIIKELDLACLESIRSFAKELLAEVDSIDVLINNAGVYQCHYMQTADGFEMQMGVNHFGHFLLTNLLLDKIKCSKGRIVIVSSGLHKYGDIDIENLNSERQYDRAKAYCNSKLANNLFARQLSKKLEGTGVGVYCLRPGMVRTNLGQHRPLPWYLKLLYPLAYLLTKSPYEGCQTVLYCAVAKELEGISGGYYANCERAEWTTVSLREDIAEQLWIVSAQLTRCHEQN